MRTQLEQMGTKERHTFTGEFERFGEKKGYKGSIEKTVLLLNIKDAEGNIVTDHLWFNYTRGFARCKLQQNDVVQFDARVATYWKGYMGYRDDDYYLPPVEMDYKLSYPTKISIFKRKNASAD